MDGYIIYIRIIRAVFLSFHLIRIEKKVLYFCESNKQNEKHSLFTDSRHPAASTPTHTLSMYLSIWKSSNGKYRALMSIHSSPFFAKILLHRYLFSLYP